MIYTLPQNKRNFSRVAFLLGKSVHNLILYPTVICDKIDMTLDQGWKSRGNGKKWAH